MFGGRSSEHAVSCVTAGSVLQAIDPDRYDVVPVGITHDGRWVLESAEPGRLAITSRRRAARGRRLARRRSPWRSRTAAASSSCTSRARCPAPSARSTWSSRCCTGRGARTAPCRACWRWPASGTSAPGVLASAVGMDKHYMKVVLAGARPAGAALHGDHRRAAGRPTAAACVETVDVPGLPGVREAGPRRLEHRDQQGARPATSSTPPSRRPAGTTPRCSSRSRPRAAARSSAACSRASAPTRPTPRSVAEIIVDGPRVLRLRREVPPRGAAPGSTVPADLPDAVDAPGSRSCRPQAFDGARRARGWPGWTSSCCPTSGW